MMQFIQMTKIQEMTPLTAQNWTNADGETMHVFRVALDDGTVGRVNAKSSSPWYNVGTKVVAKIRGTRDGVVRLQLMKPEFADVDATKPAGAAGATKPAGAAGIAADDDVVSLDLAKWAIEMTLRYYDAGHSADEVREWREQLIDNAHKLKLYHRNKYGS